MSTGPIQLNERIDVRLEHGAGVSVRVYGKGPRLVMSHGNGLAIDAYQPFWRLFVDDHQVVIFDFRHHGQSSPYTRAVDNWPQFVRDFDQVLEAIALRLGDQPTAGVFHSMSALTALLHAARHESPWSALVAFEPPVPPPSGTQEAAEYVDFHRRHANVAARRRKAFTVVDELMLSFANRNAFSRLSMDAMRRLAEATLRWNPVRSRFELACAPEFEAETFRLRHLQGAWEEITTLSVPVCVVSSDPTSSKAAYLPEISRRLAAAGDFLHRQVSNSTHFLQLERPHACATIVREFLQVCPWQAVESASL